MGHTAKRFQRLECAICGQFFDTLSEFKGHTANGELCEGGTPYA